MFSGNISVSTTYNCLHTLLFTVWFIRCHRALLSDLLTYQHLQPPWMTAKRCQWMFGRRSVETLVANVITIWAIMQRCKGKMRDPPMTTQLDVPTGTPNIEQYYPNFETIQGRLSRKGLQTDIKKKLWSTYSIYIVNEREFCYIVDPCTSALTLNTSWRLVQQYSRYTKYGAKEEQAMAKEKKHLNVMYCLNSF